MTLFKRSTTFSKVIAFSAICQCECGHSEAIHGPPSVSKTCPKCEQDKYFSEFGKDKSKKSGLSSYCKKCASSNRLQNYKSSIGKHKEKLKGIGTRFIDYHDSSVRSKKLITHPSLATFLKAVLTPEVSVFQSLIFNM